MQKLVWAGIYTRIQVWSEDIYLRTYINGFYSLTQEASLTEIDYLRRQIFRIKGNDTVSPIPLYDVDLSSSA